MEKERGWGKGSPLLYPIRLYPSFMGPEGWSSQLLVTSLPPTPLLLSPLPSRHLLNGEGINKSSEVLPLMLGNTSRLTRGVLISCFAISSARQESSHYLRDSSQILAKGEQTRRMERLGWDPGGRGPLCSPLLCDTHHNKQTLISHTARL